MLGKGQSGGYPPETSDLMKSIGATLVDGISKKGLEAGSQLQGSVQAAGQQQQQQQNQQLLLTPASLQLAQLQAQLTLQRLKLAQAQGGNTASAATVLNQVLSNVAMSQPLFNQLRTVNMVGNSQGAFPTGVLGLPSSNAALGALVGGGFQQNPENVRFTHAGGGGPVNQQAVEYCKKSASVYPSDTDRRLQYNLEAGTAVDGQYSVSNSQGKNINNAGFQRNFFSQDMQGQQSGFNISEQWKQPVSLSHTGNADIVSNSGAVWTAAGQPIRSRNELYNPEEPTSEAKFNQISSLSSTGSQGFAGYQTLHGAEGTQSSGTRILQPYQVNDYHAVTPTQLPHQCSICDKKVYNLKDWDQHVKGKLHLQNRTLYSNQSSAVLSAGAVQYPVGRPSDGGLIPGGTNSMVFSASSQDVSSAASASYLPAAAMTTYPLTDPEFASHQPESKPFQLHKATTGRVVHICNLPEGSCTENDVVNLGLPFGKVTNYILMRSTHQAFLEMAYVEAAQAMVQYYQLTPAMINNQKVLIRMSKRYKELQLKKPGRDVQSIIHNITSQRERDEMQELDHYLPERTRSRSPIGRSLSPHSHSPSVTPCNSGQSPQGGACRNLERSNPGIVCSRGMWDWSPQLRRGEDERERDDPRRNGGSIEDDRHNGRAADRRKAYQKQLDHMSSRSADERGGSSGGSEAMRGNREWHSRGSPQGMSFNSYRSMDDDFYILEQIYKSDKQPRLPYQRHDSKLRRRDGGEYHSRSRHSEVEMSEESLRRTPEEKRQSSPSRGRSKKSNRRHAAEKFDKENNAKNTVGQTKERTVSPKKSDTPKEATECHKDRDTEKEPESGVDTDEECWYPKNMEELVTVDEVGEEDDSIIEPDLPEIDEDTAGPKPVLEKEAVEEHVPMPPLSPEQDVDKKTNQEKSCVESMDRKHTYITDDKENVVPATVPEEQKSANQSQAPKQSLDHSSNSPCQDIKTALEETSLEDKVPNSDLLEPHVTMSDTSKSQDTLHVTETITNGLQHKDGKKEMMATSPAREQDKAVSEHSIPLGVEFIVPRTGFFCKLCGLFYTSEENAKTTHCRSAVHYKNLQKYLSQLAEQSLSDAFYEPMTAQ